MAVISVLRGGHEQSQDVPAGIFMEPHGIYRERNGWALNKSFAMSGS
jgi:hypothetical protein